MSHHVGASCEPVDPRLVLADYRQPIVHVMRRINNRIMECKGVGGEQDRADKALIVEAIEHTPGVFCKISPGPRISPVGMTCTHGPAEAALFTPPPYKRPVIGGLW